jgi:thiamine-monophosphate kinase
VLRGELPHLSGELAAFLIQRYRLPQPRTMLGPQLIDVATAALDVSDGLVADLRHICEVSKLSAIIDSPRVPLSGRGALAADPRLLNPVLAGGDVSEILFTAAPRAAETMAELSRSSGVPIMQIARMIGPSEKAGYELCVLDRDGQPVSLVCEGWTHF